MDEELTHVDAEGRARMVDVSGKPETRRRAVAEATVRMHPDTLALVKQRRVTKGDVEAVARLAAVAGAKKTAELVPLCHPLRITDVDVDIVLGLEDHALIRVEVRAVDRTGVEMEALTGACSAALAFYDMIKGVDRSAQIESVRLLEKEGGRSGHWMREEDGR